jgi:hypothetical protein
MEQKQDEEFVIFMANAIANPWTMVVHSHYTRFTSAAVMGSRWSE